MKNWLYTALVVSILLLQGCTTATKAGSTNLPAQGTPVVAPAVSGPTASGTNSVPQEAHGVINPPPDGTELPPVEPVIGADVPKGVAEFLQKQVKTSLDPALSAEKPDWDRLTDWRLESITLKDGVYFTSFAVLPAVRESNWWAGSGSPGKAGWILHKMRMSRVTEQNGTYQEEPGIP